MKKFMLTLALLFMFVLVISGCAPQEVKIVLGESASPWSGMTIVAKEKGYFAEEGVNVKVMPFTSGKVAHETLIGEGIDMATSPDIPLIASTFIAPENFKVVATIMRTNNGEKLLVLNEKIKEPKEIEGKKIAILHTSTSHYFATGFMEKNGIDASKVEFINLKPFEMSAALETGSIDGYFAWEPFIYHGKKAFGEDATVYEDKSIYPATMNLGVSTKLLQENPEEAEKVLRALVKAERFIKTNPEQAKQIIAVRLGFDIESFEALWSDYDYTLTLDTLLLETFAKQQQWAVEEGIQKGTPDSIDKYIETTLLEEVKPEAVTI